MCYFTDVKNTLDDLQKVTKNFQNKADFTDDLEKLTGVSVLLLCDIICKPYNDVFFSERNNHVSFFNRILEIL